MSDIEPTQDRDEWLTGDDADEVVTFPESDPPPIDLLAALQRSLDSAREERLTRDGGEQP